MSKELFLLRGLPGAGKSTLAKILVGDKDYCHKEADMFHVNGKGEYKWKPENVKEAHNWCQSEVEFLMKYEHNVVVSNTFTQEWEMQVYYDLAKKYGYKVNSIIVENRHGGVNQHGVPDDILTKMRDRFEIKL
jgi:predicted kinase